MVSRHAQYNDCRKHGMKGEKKSKNMSEAEWGPRTALRQRTTTTDNKKPSHALVTGISYASTVLLRKIHKSLISSLLSSCLLVNKQSNAADRSEVMIREI